MQPLTKLKWQCRRGTQELDKLLIHYLENSYANAPLTEQQEFQQLLKLEDSELLHLFFTHDLYLMTASPQKDWQSYTPQQELSNLVAKIRSANF